MSQKLSNKSTEPSNVILTVSCQKGPFGRIPSICHLYSWQAMISRWYPEDSKIITYDILSSDLIDGLVQKRCNSNRFTMELLFSCTNPLLWCLKTTRLVVWIIESLWNLTCSLATNLNIFQFCFVMQIVIHSEFKEEQLLSPGLNFVFFRVSPNTWVKLWLFFIVSPHTVLQVSEQLSTKSTQLSDVLGYLCSQQALLSKWHSEDHLNTT